MLSKSQISRNSANTLPGEASRAIHLILFYPEKATYFINEKKKKVWTYESMLLIMGFFSGSTRIMLALLADLLVSHTLVLDVIMFLCNVNFLNKVCRQVLQTSVFWIGLDKKVNETVQITSHEVSQTMFLQRLFQ